MMTLLIISFAILTIITTLAFLFFQKRKLHVAYEDVVVNGQMLTKEQTRKEPNVQVFIEKPWSIAMIDLNAVGLADHESVYLHWLKNDDQTVVPYQGPTPPAGTGTHQYQFKLYTGHGEKEERNAFHLNQFEKNHKTIESVGFQISA